MDMPLPGRGAARCLYCTTFMHCRGITLLGGLLWTTLVLLASTWSNTTTAIGTVGNGYLIDGREHTCPDFVLFITPLIEITSLPDPGWVLVRNSGGAPTFRSISGKVLESQVSHSDFPDVHDSHDFNADILLDSLDTDNAGLPLLSQHGKDSNGDFLPDTIEIEWETGILTTEEHGDGFAHFFPKWAWPMEGDRVWANGYWIFDCGHPSDNGAARTEIHPPRAVASMRNQVAQPPGEPAPVPVTATDLYIHGRAGVVTDLLICGNSTINDGDGIIDTRECKAMPGFFSPAGCDASDGYCHDPVADHLGIPIDDNYQFDICVPPKPSASARLVEWIETGPGNTVDNPALQAVLDEVPVTSTDPAVDACAASEFGPTKVHVSVNLAGSGVAPDDVYARHIYAGWADAPVRLRHFRLTMDSLYMRNDHDSDTLGITNRGELSFFWAGMDRGGGPTSTSDEWVRLSDQTTGDMGHLGSGESRTFNNTTWDFVIPDGAAFTLRANGYDGGVDESPLSIATDCLDDHFGHHDIAEHLNFLPPFEFIDTCYALLSLDAGTPDNDALRPLTAVFEPANNYRLGLSTVQADNYCTLNVVQGPTIEIPCSEPERSQTIQFYLNQGIVFTLNAVKDYDFHVSVQEIPMDSDGDGLLDTDEENTYGTDPLDFDTDDDGLGDGAEVNTYGTDPRDADSDDDGLTDGEEVNTYGTDPLDADTDDDGLKDGNEVTLGTNPLDADSDDDGIPDGSDPGSFVNLISNLPDSVFKSTGPGSQNAILDALTEIEKKIAMGKTAGALKQIRDLRTKLDGCGAQPDNSDWITDCAAQITVRELLDLLTTNLSN